MGYDQRVLLVGSQDWGLVTRCVKRELSVIMISPT
jgi:hypothetical protein